MFYMMNWREAINKREDELIRNTQSFLQIKSVLDEETANSKAPFGKGIKECYDWFLTLAEKDGFTVKDVDGYAGHIEWGEGEEIIGVLCHLDVVPEGDGWTSPPYAAEIRDGKIYARGAIDDKGPTMAAYSALKLLKELDLPLKKRVRIIVGNDEESQWRCVSHYFKHEDMPSSGFAPDASFPIIYAEKGICDLEYTKDITLTEQGIVKEFYSGERFNMVPEQATAVLTEINHSHVEESFNLFLHNQNLSGTVRKEGEELHLKLNGKSAHGLEPEKGINAGLMLAHYLVEELSLTGEELSYFTTLNNYLYKGSRGDKLDIAFKDEEKGAVTLNTGILRYKPGFAGVIGINLRYPQGAQFTSMHEKINAVFKEHNYTGTIKAHEKPHAVEKNHPLIKTLSKVYEEQTGEEAVCIAIGGGTYARSLKAGVAYGPLFPDQEDVAHQANEYISIDNLKKATAIYAQAIYELAK